MHTTAASAINIQPWCYIFSDQRTLRLAGVLMATPVIYDPSSGMIEFVDDAAGCAEWIINSERCNHGWLETLEGQHVRVVVMDASDILSIDDQCVRLRTSAQKLLYIDQMQSIYLALMRRCHVPLFK